MVDCSAVNSVSSVLYFLVLVPRDFLFLLMPSVGYVI